MECTANGNFDEDGEGVDGVIVDVNGVDDGDRLKGKTARFRLHRVC
jgi:hypothetical protein